MSKSLDSEATFEEENKMALEWIEKTLATSVDGTLRVVSSVAEKIGLVMASKLEVQVSFDRDHFRIGHTTNTHCR